MVKNKGYAGKVANTGSQRVAAPCAKSAPSVKGSVRHSGSDLRTGTGSGGSAKKSIHNGMKKHICIRVSKQT